MEMDGGWVGEGKGGQADFSHVGQAVGAGGGGHVVVH